MEQWRPIPGYGDLYEVSDCGRVRSLDRLTETRSGPRKYRGRCLRPGVDRKGYLAVSLCRVGVVKMCAIAGLVLSAFKGPRPKGTECCHNDGNKANNHLANLRYDTRKANHADKIVHGTHSRGSRSPTAKITEEQAKAVLRDTRVQRIVAQELGVSQSLVSRIKLKKAWAHL